MKQMRWNGRNDIVPLPCASASLRRAARIVTQRYDRKMRASGLKGTQFTLLQALMITGDISQGKLGEILGLDSTTLTRTLALLRKKHWIQAKPGEDRREVRLSLTAEGKRKYQSALPYWQSAQRELRAALGKAGWNQIMEATLRTAASLSSTERAS
jgi:DNA-binding MarR family transcriptional regulator